VRRVRDGESGFGRGLVRVLRGVGGRGLMGSWGVVDVNVLGMLRTRSLKDIHRQ
jgi:hypothetical protein